MPGSKHIYLGLYASENEAAKVRVALAEQRCSLLQALRTISRVAGILGCADNLPTDHRLSTR